MGPREGETLDATAKIQAQHEFMSSPLHNDGRSHSSSPSCRVLTISPSLSLATLLVHRIHSLTGSLVANYPVPLTPTDPLQSNDLIVIPWTISNKYYNADVHFALHTVRGLSPHQFQDVPAVIYVWAVGQSFRDDISRIAQDAKRHEPEVCLAVRLPAEAVESGTSQSADEPEDYSELDGFLSQHGFEYVDATKPGSSRATSLEDDDREDDIPRLPRVLDALSTIMWPTMNRSQGSSSGRNSSRKQREFLNWAQASQDDNFSGSMDVNNIKERPSELRREMQELERWLEDSLPEKDDPWRTIEQDQGLSQSPTSMEFGKETPKLGPMAEPGELGFDDDFTVFVSAPTDVLATPSNSSTPEMPVKDLPSSLLASHPNSLYRSLGSVSDFGGSEDGDDDVEGEMPTREEIVATSERIFGVRGGSTDSTVESQGAGPMGGSGRSQGFPLNSSFDEEEYEMAPFDLSRVFGTLQEMKAEIARMDDEGERRKAAARVALGLVYGLETDHDRSD